MDSATQDLLYQKINESVYDEEKIVTCASILNDLKISLENAKTLLKTFVDDSRSLQHKELYATYLLSGSLKDGKGLAVYLVKEDDLNEKKSLFESISSEVVYSIQKNKPIDFNTIALTEKKSLKASDGSRAGYIVGKNCIKRDIKKKILPSPPKEVNLVKEKKSFFQKIASNGELPKAETQSTSRESLQTQEKQTKRKPSGMMANFLSSAPRINGNVKSESEDQKLEDKITKNENTNIKKEEEENINVDNGKENADDGKMDVDEDVVPPVSQKRSSQAKAPSKKRKKENKSNNTSNKKRRRIQDICDSDSGDIFGSEEQCEDIIEKSDEEPEPIVMMKPVLQPKNKRRKAVDKTYMDDEGFMVTTTEYIYESASEDEEKAPEKPVLQACPEKPKAVEKKNSMTDSENDVKNSKNKGKKNSKKATTGKQTTLMSFFKKN